MKINCKKTGNQIVYTISIPDDFLTLPFTPLDKWCLAQTPNKLVDHMQRLDIIARAYDNKGRQG